MTGRGLRSTTTSLAIAEGVGYGHATVIKLIKRRADKLEQFGNIGFEIQNSDLKSSLSVRVERT